MRNNDKTEIKESGFDFETVVEMQIKTCKLHSKKNALGTFKNGKYEWMTYEELDQAISALRSILSSKYNIGYDDKVALISNNRVEWAVSFYAINSLGAQVVPMYEAQSEKDWTYILTDSAAKLVIVANEGIHGKLKPHIGQLGRLEAAIVMDCEPSQPYSFHGLLATPCSVAVPPVSPSPQDLTSIIYTSGTTGNPKGVELTHANVSAVVQGSRPLLGEYLFGQVSLAFLPWAHVYGLSCELHGMLANGNALCIVEKRELIMDCLQAAQPTLLMSVPVLYNKIFDGVMKAVHQGPFLRRAIFHHALRVGRDRNALVSAGRPVGPWLALQHRLLDRAVFRKIRDKISPRIQLLTCGGAAMPQPVLEFFEAIGLPVLEGYGLTETAPTVTMNGAALRDRLLGSVGLPLRGVTVAVVDPDSLQPLPPDTDGEVAVAGPTVMRGYHNNPQASQEVFFLDQQGQRFFRTGDLGRLVGGRFLKITGRIKEQFKLENGKFVVPAPLEDALARSPLVLQVFVYGHNRPHTVALVVPNLPELAARLAGDKALGPALQRLAGEADQALFDSVFAAPNVQQMFSDELARAARNLAHFARPALWAPLLHPFTQENQQLTPKMSLRRTGILTAHQATLDRLYAGQTGFKISYHNSK